jgi:hypothetical protein
MSDVRSTTFQIMPRFVLPLLALGLSACAPFARYETAGTLAGQSVETRVDSREAAYYLENYLPGESNPPGQLADPDLATRIDETLAEVDPAPADREGLSELSRALSTDFATMHFVSRLYADAGNRRMQDRFLELVDELSNASQEEIIANLEPYQGYKIVFVPGYAYRSNLANGADFRRQRELLTELGFDPGFIETEELGTVEVNADIVTRELRVLVGQHDEIVVVSTSKGGPEVAIALDALRSDPQASSIKAWISVGGLLRGSPYADRYMGGLKGWLAQLMLRRRGQPPEILENLSTIVRRPIFDRLRLPPNVLMLQYVGAPLSGHVRDETRSRYRILRRLGPNDGLTLLADELIAGGFVVTEVGLDHYFRASDIDIRTVALTYAVLDELERRASAAQPRISRLGGNAGSTALIDRGAAIR